MSLQRLWGRVTHLAVQRRPWVVADVLRRARQCAPSELGPFLVDALTSVDKAAATAIMDQLSDVEFEALLGPEFFAFLDALPESELDAIARGDPTAIRRCQRALQRWRSGRA
jgi:hypothetical protein